MKLETYKMIVPLCAIKDGYTVKKIHGEVEHTVRREVTVGEVKVYAEEGCVLLVKGGNISSFPKDKEVVIEFKNECDLDDFLGGVEEI